MDYSNKISELAGKAYDYYNIPANTYTSLNLKRGLRNQDGTGVLAGLTRICEVHGYVMSEDEKTPIPGQLSYRGYDINDLTANPGIDHRFGFEEIAYLLIFGNLPTNDELISFCECLAELRELPDYFAEDMIIKAPSRNVMNKMARSVLALYSYDDNPDSTDIENVMRQSLLLLARMPILAVYGYDAKVHHYDRKSLIMHNPKPGLSTAENLLRMLSRNKEFTPLEAEVLDTALMLHAEHGGGNNSTFSCRVLSSTGTDTYSAIASAVCSLKGPKHGGANAQVIGMMDDLQQNVENWSDDDQIYDYLLKVVRKEAYDKSGLIYGLGHAVYTLSDPRAVLLKAKAKQLCEEKGQLELFNMYESVERLGPKAFAEVKKVDRAMCANVDLYSGLIYRMLNIPQEMFTPIFAIARTAGWCAHRMEELISGGKIIRPAYKTVIKRGQQYVDINDR